MGESTVRQWSSYDVQAWLLSLNIPCDAPLLQAVDGKFLYQLHSLRAEAPEFFYQCLRRDLGFVDLRDLLNFAGALKSLLAQDSASAHAPRDVTIDTDQRTSSPEVDTPVPSSKEAKMTAAVTEENLASEQESGTGKASIQDTPGAKEEIIPPEQMTTPEQSVPPPLTTQEEGLGARAESPALTAALQGLPPVTAGASASPVPEVSSAEFAAILKRELAVALERTSRGSPSPPPTRQQDESKDKGKDGKH
ncbi:PREDICTED: uncharacterized protein LOC109469542 [Branchiostoma belcheri]|uniref:Uncharacterized protein LOC109469542 n=1 Tax=Branchiostoma belcheri TaxID=7741 RepID=A0A6P4YXV3_BRABE|nr:PREDICTED: uncharacterized protein LOC109469542 [Branchiostoma belcheri]